MARTSDITLDLHAVVDKLLLLKADLQAYCIGAADLHDGRRDEMAFAIRQLSQRATEVEDIVMRVGEPVIVVTAKRAPATSARPAASDAEQAGPSQAARLCEWPRVAASTRRPAPRHLGRAEESAPMARLPIQSLLTITFVLACALGRAGAQGSPPSPEALEKLVAPIALYPDPLVAQVLPASTNPLEIFEAADSVANGQRPAE